MNTRFAPSPTGHLHIGGARTALFSYLAAKVNNGYFSLRYEDTDLVRSQMQYEKSIAQSLQWLGIIPDATVKQSERSHLYHQKIEELLAFGFAYHCDCSVDRLDALRTTQRQNKEIPRYDNLCRNQGVPASNHSVIRFNLSALREDTLSFDDIIHGQMHLNIDQLDDFVLRRSIDNYGSEDGFTYNFCASVDDHDMQIQYVIRGDDHIRNTFRQVAVSRVLNWKLPNYCHLPMVLNERGQRLSKRDGAANVLDFAQMGIPAEPLIDYLARLGWSHGDEEVFGLQKLEQLFKLQDVSTSPAKFDLNKLRSLSSIHIKKLSSAELFAQLEKYLLLMDKADETKVASGFNHQSLEAIIDQYGKPRIELAMQLMLERSSTLQELVEQIAQLYLDITPLEQIAKLEMESNITTALMDLNRKWQQVSDAKWHSETLQSALKATLVEHHLKFPQLAMPVRFLLFGQTKGPSIVALAECLGKNKTLEKLTV